MDLVHFAQLEEGEERFCWPVSSLIACPSLLSYILLLESLAATPAQGVV